jgi:hypothetical protein
MKKVMLFTLIALFTASAFAQPYRHHRHRRHHHHHPVIIVR